MRILHLEHDLHDVELVRDLLRHECPEWIVFNVSSRREFIAALSMEKFDVILADFRLPDFNGLDALTLSQQLAVGTPFVFFSGSIGEDQAVAALQAGAADYVVKDRMKRLVSALRRVVADRREQFLRRAAENSLLASQSRYQRLVDEAPDAIFSLSSLGIITSLNPAFEKITGWRRDQWLHQSFVQLVHESDRARAIELFQRVQQGVRPPFEVRLNKADGGNVTLEFIVSYLPQGGGSGEILGIARDITARRAAQRVIAEQAEIMNMAPVGIVITDLDERITYWNTGAEKIWGCAAAATVGRAQAEVFEPATLAALRPGHAATDESGDWRGEVSIATRDGRQLHLELCMSTIRDENRAPKGRLTVALDITEKARLQEQFLRVQRVENLGLLAAGIAHDFNNILSPILMVAQLLRLEAAPDARERLLGTLEQSAERGAALVRQILSFAHGGESGRIIVQLKHLVRDIAAMIEETFPRSIALDLDIPGDTWSVHANPTQIHQVLLNLAVNARDAMPHGGRLRLALRNCELDAVAAGAIEGARPGRFIQLEVADTGLGIPPEIFPKIWEPFFTTKAKDEGTGLGLSTVRGIVRQHEGFAQLTSVPQQGTSFRLYFPAVETTPATNEQAAPASGQHGSGELIFVIEDEPGVRQLVQTVLTRHDYTVVVARDGVEAMNLLRLYRYQPQVIVTDISMPRLGGDALLTLLRRQVPRAALIVMSGMEADTTPAHSLRGHVDAFLLKPFKPDALLDAISRLLARPAAGSDSRSHGAHPPD